MKDNSRFEVVQKNGRAFLRHWHPLYDWRGGYEDRMIYGAKTETPYIKWNWLRMELDAEMIEQLRAIQAAA